MCVSLGFMNNPSPRVEPNKGLKFNPNPCMFMWGLRFTITTLGFMNQTTPRIWVRVNPYIINPYPWALPLGINQRVVM